MLVTSRPVRHLIRLAAVACLLAAPLPVLAQQQAPDPSGSSTFVVLLDGTRIGTESVTIQRAGNEWIVSGTGIVLAPLDLSTMKFEMRYGLDWQPQRMVLESALRGQPLAINTTFGLTTATNAMTQGDQRGNNSHQITPRAVVIPNNFFGAYESLAVRLSSLSTGGRLPVYVPPSGETSVTVAQISPRRVSLGDERTLELREYLLTVMNSSGAIPVEMWIDERGRMARLVMPTASLVVIREDLANVLAREERLTVAGDDDVFIGATGFSLGATVTKNPSVTGRAPAVVLAGGPGPQDRDHVSYGIPLYAQLARSLSEAGYIVVRYDARGMGRSGGRAESSRLQEYTDDVLSVVEWLRRRDDVDRDRIAVLGYGDTVAIALSAARRSDRIGAVALVNAPGRAGREVTLERQRMALAATSLPETERQNRLALQARVLDAVVSGRGWELLSEEVRAQADTPWFRSWLQYDPAELIRRMDQPVLALHGSLDTEVPPAHADEIQKLGLARRNRPATHSQAVIVPGVNHLMMQAKTGAVDEYATLEPRVIASELSTALTQWLATALAAR
ncbi:MAG: alpha/beta fold hydrolase [Acidobacteria bacterium]|nr:alpha/beta fold hydrolase [Acidobacteriota bacterium]